MQMLARALDGRIHYAWIVAGATFLCVLISAGVRAAPGVLLVPLEQAFGWDRATISVALAVGLLLYGLVGPFAAALALRIGVRRTMLLGLGVMAGAVGASALMTKPWHLMLTWGVLVGLGSGTVALSLGASIVNRWFVEGRGLVMGLLSASMALGQLIFLPSLAAVASTEGWRPVAWIVAAALGVAVPIAYLLIPERPSDLGLRARGADRDAVPEPRRGNPILVAFESLAVGMRSRDFWLLAGSFFVCGLSTNGLIGTHLVAACFDHGIPEVRAASLLALIGVCNLIGTTLSGWLSDRYDNRWLLFWYYGLRGLSLFVLPYSDFSFYGLALFAVFYGLDWLATVPPTMRLTSDIFGRDMGPVMFGWLMAAHQIGSAVAASGAGFLRTATDRYFEAFLIAGLACVMTALMVLMIGRRPDIVRPVPA